MKLRFDCLFHYVADFDKAVAFYRDVLGLHLTSQDVVARFDIDGVQFELVRAAAAQGGGGCGSAHLCLGVSDMEEARAWLSGKGVEVSVPQQVEGGVLAAFVDPDGNEIYLWEAADGGAPEAGRAEHGELPDTHTVNRWRAQGGR